MIDSVVVIMSFITFVCFVVGLTLSVRAHGQTGILTGIKQIFITLLLISSVIVWIALGNLPILLKCILLLVYLVLVWSLSFAYIIGLFGLPLTSLRIQVLLTIAGAGEQGISFAELSKKYSNATVVKQRLHRLETSGEIARRGSTYILHSKWSYFMLHNYFLLLLLTLYRPFPPK